MERWVLCVRFSRAPLWLLIGATGKGRDLLEAVVARQRETVLAGTGAGGESGERSTGLSMYVGEGCIRACRRSACFLKERGVKGVLKCFFEKLQGRVDLYRGLADWEEVVLIWGWWRTRESALNTLSCKSLLDTQGGGVA